MTSEDLARSYLSKAEKRLKVLALLLKEEDYSDVIREAQELVELCVKGMLRAVGIEPPKFHDVGFLLLEHKERFRPIKLKDLRKAARISKRLRKEREFAFYGDIDFIPTEEYSKKDAVQAVEEAKWVVKLAQNIIK
ncbi:MAG: HEPN domain-containing protein [Nitrospirae bacterium]|nr:HEPN domain-containing protein [Nitrospirota bacterium]